MLLHLLRHAHAADASDHRGPDATRPLTDKGREQSRRLGRFLADHRFATDRIVTSPRVRARETAEIVAELLGVSAVVDDRLGGALDLAILEALLDDHDDPHRPILVGHDPDFSDLVATLADAAGATMRKGAFARIEVARPLTPGAGVLRWLSPPDALRSEG